MMEKKRSKAKRLMLLARIVKRKVIEGEEEGGGTDKNLISRVKTARKVIVVVKKVMKAVVMKIQRWKRNLV